MLRSAYSSVDVPAAFFVSVTLPVKEAQNCALELSMVGLHLLSSLPDAFSNLITYSPLKVPESHIDRRNLTF